MHRKPRHEAGAAVSYLFAITLSGWDYKAATFAANAVRFAFFRYAEIALHSRRECAFKNYSDLFAAARAPCTARNNTWLAFFDNLFCFNELRLDCLFDLASFFRHFSTFHIFIFLIFKPRLGALTLTSTPELIPSHEAPA